MSLTLLSPMMTYILIGIVILISLSITNFLFNRRKLIKIINHLNMDKEQPTAQDGSENHEEKEDDETAEPTSSRQHNNDSREDSNREELFNILKGMGCQPSVNEDNNLGFSYQGENFLIMFNGVFIRIWDLSWLSMKNTDDSFTLLKDATNYANFSFGPTIVLHSPDENGNIIFSSRMDIPYSSNMNDGKGYIIALLDSFFGLKNSLHREISRLKDDPHDRTLHDNPIGFDTASLADPSSPQAN